MSNFAFQNFEELKAHVVQDKESEGIGVSNRDRYPIRFVLFDNFRDCYEFVDYLQQEREVQVESVDQWIDAQYPDLLITHVALAEKIKSHITKMKPNDCVIAPFSELARFYENSGRRATFDTLLKTIKGIEASPEGVDKHQRVYIPVVGLHGKMENFVNDSQTTIWYLKSENKDLTYRLILTDGKDFGLKGLEENYSVVNNIREWLNIWKDSKQQVTPHIICKSRAIFANAEYAQPDNAFSFAVCNNAYEFLTNGLHLSFGGMQPLASDGDNWEYLASLIKNGGEGFSFEKFVKSYFGVSETETPVDFMRIWFTHVSIFDRWLIARYYLNKNNDEGYLSRIIKNTSFYGNNQLLEVMMLDISDDSEEMSIRRSCLQLAAKHNIIISDAAESTIASKLEALPTKYGYNGALRLFTGISQKEKEIIVNWLGQEKINVEDIKEIYPDLYSYACEGVGLIIEQSWVENYIKSYKKAKISNLYSKEIEEKIKNLNANESSFDTWYNTFSSTYTLLRNRGDIEVFYWIDGLGVDWIPFIKNIIFEKKEQHIYLNEIMIARSLLPTKTDINRKDLQRLLPEGEILEKAGDLDALAHKNNNVCPYVLNVELELVRKTIEDILNKYIGKKIAIISDHGLSYLPQLLQGKNLAGVESDHHGRVALRKKVSSTSDESYFRLDDDKTLCALKHESLCGKVPSNQGIHGGCTPEEVLVPIFVISSAPAATNWSADLCSLEVSGTNPCVQFTIKNLPSTDKPFVIYNGKKYDLNLIDKELYESMPLQLENDEHSVTLCIGSVERVFNIQVNTGIEMDDLFGGF